MGYFRKANLGFAADEVVAGMEWLNILNTGSEEW